MGNGASSWDQRRDCNSCEMSDRKGKRESHRRKLYADKNGSTPGKAISQLVGIVRGFLEYSIPEKLQAT